MTYLYSVFIDDHEHGSMRMVATYLDKYAAVSHARAMSSNGDGVTVKSYQAINDGDLDEEAWPAR